METGPGGILGGPSRVSEMLDKLPVEVQKASGRDGNLGQPLLDPGCLQKVCRREDRRFRRIVLQKRCLEAGGVFVNAGPLGQETTNVARSERSFTHDGVAAHPGDKGMQAIADAIVQAVLKRGVSATP